MTSKTPRGGEAGGPGKVIRQGINVKKKVKKKVNGEIRNKLYAYPG